MRGSVINCTHETKIRRKRNAAGQWMLRAQCAKCGGYGFGNGSALPMSRLGGRPIESVPEFDEVAFAAAEEEQARQRRQEYFARKLDVMIEAANDDISAEDPYYDSDDWREIRRLVITRAGGVCEGCGKQQATQAHHLHYRTFGHEFLWDLRAVCRDCHERVHGIQKQAETEVMAQLSSKARRA